MEPRTRRLVAPVLSPWQRPSNSWRNPIIYIYNHHNYKHPTTHSILVFRYNILWPCEAIETYKALTMNKELMQLLQTSTAPASRTAAAAPSEHDVPASSAVASTADADEKRMPAAAPAAPPSPPARPPTSQEVQTPPAASRVVEDYLANVYADSHRRSPRGPRWCDVTDLPATQAEPETLIPVPGLLS